MDRAESRYLRVAIFWKESIVAEKVFKKGEKIYIGEEIDNTFIVPSTQLPARFLLLDPMANGGYVLHLKDSMQGRVAPKGKPVAVAEFLKSGAANRQGDEYLAEVSGADWGSLTIGNLVPIIALRRFQLFFKVGHLCRQALDSILNACGLQRRVFVRVQHDAGFF